MTRVKIWKVREAMPRINLHFLALRSLIRCSAGHYVDDKASNALKTASTDQTAQMCRLIGVFVGHFIR